MHNTHAYFFQKHRVGHTTLFDKNLCLKIFLFISLNNNLNESMSVASFRVNDVPISNLVT